MGEVIRFPLERRLGILPPPQPSFGDWSANITMQGPVIGSECTEVVHNFDSVPGHCRCGKNYWDPPAQPSAS